MLRARTGFPSWERLTPLIRAISWLAGYFGKDEGGVIFEVGGVKSGKLKTHRIAVMAQKDGGFIPSALAAILADGILRGREFPIGLVPLPQWIEPACMVSDLQERGLRVWWQETLNSPWGRLRREI
jgi:hypothetical protein